MVLRRILRAIGHDDGALDYTTLPERRVLLKVAEEKLHWRLRDT